jgi:predicted alpha/beta-fold hydrolase
LPPDLPGALGLPPFRPRPPWLNGDLQTVRDSLRPVSLPPDGGTPVEIAVGNGDRLLGLLDPPLKLDHGGDNGGRLRPCGSDPIGLVLLMHGLGGSSGREGLRRMGLTLQHAGFSVLRLNMRGAGPGRRLARGTDAARCNSDLLPAIARARQLAQGRPLLGMGISLGGTKLLNAVLAGPQERLAAGLASGPLLDGVVCISSPLDLEACSRQIALPRNRVYQRWLLRRLLQQTLEDPFGVSEAERAALTAGHSARLRSIRAFDVAITAPRWGYADVDSYYRQASPLKGLLRGLSPAQQPSAALPPTLLLHAADDPWVPVDGCRQLQELQVQLRRDQPGGQAGTLEVLITARGGHNGFHACGDGAAGAPGNWGDRLTALWLRRLLGA